MSILCFEPRKNAEGIQLFGKMRANRSFHSHLGFFSKIFDELVFRAQKSINIAHLTKNNLESQNVITIWTHDFLSFLKVFHKIQDGGSKRFFQLPT
jgi:hypothetical protein